MTYTKIAAGVASLAAVVFVTTAAAADDSQKHDGAAVEVHDVAGLVKAVREAHAGGTIRLAPGTYTLDEPLVIKSSTALDGGGVGKTIITHAAGWKPSTRSLPDPEMKDQGLDADAYLVRIERDAADVTLSNMTLRAPQVHGAIYSPFSKNLQLHHLQFDRALWSGVRTFGMQKGSIHDCEFIDAGGRWEDGKPGEKGGISGGAIFAVWMADCEIANNRFRRTTDKPEAIVFGIKVREGRRCHIHHNSIECDFSMEFPFENDEDNQIDHNVCHGTISIPKHAGGPVPKSGSTFHIHHNLFKNSYSIEFVRNGVEIDHNLFDFDAKLDHGNLISAFGDVPADGPAVFHNNIVINPGRGVIWMNEVFNNLTVRNNVILCHTTATPRTDGLFGFNPGCDFKTIHIRDNRIECVGTPRPLLRAPESYAADIQNNELVNVADADKLPDAKADRKIGLEQPLSFKCGANEEVEVKGDTATMPGKLE